MEHPLELCSEFPVRKTRKQKARFRCEIQRYAQGLGYKTQVERGSMGVQNLVIGDPEKASYLVTAHYDTCARLPFPNLITPCSLPLFLAWQLFLVVLLCVPAGILGGLLATWLGIPSFCAFFAYVLLWAELILMLVGPANRYNANDNTSGVAAVLETARALPENLRDRVCFVLFDLEEAGLLGSSVYRKAHRSATDRQLILNLDCIGEGNEILLFPTKKLKKQSARLSVFRSSCMCRNGKRIELRDRGFSVYPSDQCNFPYGMGVAAFCRSRWAGLYLSRIHTSKDRVLDENNVLLVRDYLIDIMEKQA